MGHLSQRSTVHLATSQTTSALPRRRDVWLACLVLFVVVAGIPTLAAAETLRLAADSWSAEGAEFDTVRDPALEVLRDPSVWADLDARVAAVRDGGATKSLSSFLDRPYRLEHQVPLPDGRYLSVIESFTLRAWLRPVHRATLMLPGSVFTAEHFTIDAEGYDAHDIINAEGWFAFSVDYLGVDESFLPANGTKASFDANLEAMKTLVRYIRFFRQVPRVDLIGDGYGGGLAAELAADPLRIRRVVMSAMIYREVAGGPLADPGFVAFLEGMEDGYFFSPGEGSFIFMQGAPQAALDYVAATQGGLFPTPNFLVGAYRPFFDPSDAAVPGLVIYGLEDFIGVHSDVQDVASEWGSDLGLGGAELVIQPEAGHAPRTGDPQEAAAFWQEALDFLR